jgi:5-methylcytosine-specific restriction endonuclease McrA
MTKIPGSGRYLGAYQRARAQMRTARPQPCGICGRAIDYSLTKPDPGSFTVDHIRPIARGGEDVPDNYRPAHLGCNSRRRDAPAGKPELRLPGLRKNSRDWG